MGPGGPLNRGGITSDPPARDEGSGPWRRCLSVSDGFEPVESHVSRNSAEKYGSVLLLRCTVGIPGMLEDGAEI